MTELFSARRRAGFTLIETVVTVGLLAVLAAFVVPTVIQKAGSGDPVKVQNDVAAIGTAIEEFANDTKGAFPNQLHELTSKINSTQHEDDDRDSLTLLDSSQVLLWNGPYLALTADSVPTDSVPTGFTAWIKNALVPYDADHNAAKYYLVGAGTGGVFDSAATVYAAVTITGLSTTQAQTINQLINGPNANNQIVTSGAYIGANITGLFRWDKPDVTGHVVAYYLAVPITP